MGILVIADDLTGAAEIGGIALRYGLSVEIVHALAIPSNTDVQILNTNTRSLKWNEALLHLADLFPQKLPFEWDWIYLKFDSALRGHIKEETSFYRTVFQKETVVFCPVNPAAGRIIHDGIYWVEGQPISETDFARDPEFPIRKSAVLEAIRAPSWSLTDNVQVQYDTDCPYIVAAVRDDEGLKRWAAPSVSFGIYAGAAAFFEALLRQRVQEFSAVDQDLSALRSPLLYVCGSKHEKSVARMATIDSDKVVYWGAIGGEKALAQEICYKINKHGKVVFGVAPTIPLGEARIVRESMARVVVMVQEDCGWAELLIEGGATASAVLGELGVNNLVPEKEYGPGVIRNRVPHFEWMVTLKPGSYPWPESLWTF